jgi:transcription elongation factor GreA
MKELSATIESIKSALKVEIAKVRYEREVVIPEKLNIAASHGDLSENAEYEAAKDQRDYLDARLSQLVQRLHDLSEIDVKAMPIDRISIFSKVTMENTDTSEQEQYYIVLPEMVEDNSEQTKPKKISYTSPIAQQLMNKECGDLVHLNKKGVKEEYEITEFINAHGEVVR